MRQQDSCLYDTFRLLPAAPHPCWRCRPRCAAAGLARAEKADRNKPMNVEADALRYDDLKQISVFTGHVVVTKGTI